MTRGLTVLVCVVCLGVAAGVGTAAGKARLVVSVNAGVPQQAGSFAGSFNISSFAARDGQLVASGVLSGELQTAAGLVNVTNIVALPVSVGAAGCDKLRLEFGEQEVALPGVTGLIDPAVLDLTPQPRTAGLLCAAAQAPDDANALVTVLNELVSVLAD